MHMRDRDLELVSASEIASWAWCPESWRLETLGAEPGNRASLNRGEEFHARTAALEKGSRTARSLGWWLLAAAVLVAALGLLLMKG